MIVDMLIILCAALGISLISSLLHRFLINQNDVRQLKNEIKYQKERSDKARKSGDKGVETEASKELMGLSGKQMKLTMKPLMYTMIVVIAILGFMSSTYGEVIIDLPISMPTLSWAFPFLAFTKQYSWFFWYILASIPATFLFRKMLGIE